MMKWVNGGKGVHLYVEDAGRIKGRVIKLMGAKEYLASSDYGGGGNFISLDSAKDSVERAMEYDKKFWDILHRLRISRHKKWWQC